MDFLDFAIGVIPNLLIGFPASRPGGLLLSVFLAATSLPVGFLLAVPLGAAWNSQIGSVRRLARSIIEITRGLPLVFLLIVIHSLGTRAIIGVDLTPLASAWIGLVLYTAAYQSEIVRAGLPSIPPIQREAARVSGLKRVDIFRLIELPQAFHTMMPAFIGHAISLFKDTSAVLVLGVAELMTVTKSITSAGNEEHFLGLYLLAGALYYGAALAISRIANYLIPYEKNEALRLLALES